MQSLRHLVDGDWGEVTALVRGTRCEVERYLDELERSELTLHNKLFALLQSIAQNGVIRNETSFKMVRPNLFEIKSGRARLFAFYHPTQRRLVVLTHGWNKGSAKQQTDQIERALRLRNEFISEQSLSN